MSMINSRFLSVYGLKTVN